MQDTKLKKDWSLNTEAFHHFLNWLDQGVNQEVRLLEGGLSGLVRNILKQGPIRFSNVKASPNSKIAMSPDGNRKQINIEINALILIVLDLGSECYTLAIR